MELIRQVDAGISGKVGLVERLYLADRFKLAPPANWNPPCWDQSCTAAKIYGMISCPNRFFLKALA